MQSMQSASGSRGGGRRGLQPARGVRGRPASLNGASQSQGGVALPPGAIVPPGDGGGDGGGEDPPWVYYIRVYAGETDPQGLVRAGDFIAALALEVWAVPGLLAGNNPRELHAMGRYIGRSVRAAAAAAYAQGLQLEIGAELRIRGQAGSGDPSPEVDEEAKALAEQVRSWVDAAMRAAAREAGRVPEGGLGPLAYEEGTQEDGTQEGGAEHGGGEGDS